MTSGKPPISSVYLFFFRSHFTPCITVFWAHLCTYSVSESIVFLQKTLMKVMKAHVFLGTRTEPRLQHLKHQPYQPQRIHGASIFIPTFTIKNQRQNLDKYTYAPMLRGIFDTKNHPCQTRVFLQLPMT